MSAETAFVFDVLSCLDSEDAHDDARVHSAVSHAELVRRIQGGEHAAFEELLVALIRPLELYARRFSRSHDAAKDIVQDVFAHLWEQRRELTIRGSVRAYMYTMVRHRAMNIHKRDVAERARWVTAIDATSGTISHSVATPDVTVVQNELRARVAAALDTLPPRAREAALLRWTDGLSRAEIAEVMGIALGTVKGHLTLATETLRMLLADLSSPD
jgi:RNA polymerase sigma-70 factor (family 1)